MSTSTPRPAVDSGGHSHVTRDRHEWYFAYGSNLDPGTFCGRRRIQPRDARCGYLSGFDLRFDLAVGSGNRGVANLAHASGAMVWGVVYRINPTDGRRLDRSEGVHRGFYRRAEVSIACGDGMITAFTYHSPHGREERLPSARYLGLIVSGARHHGLPAAWIEQLTAWPLAIDERLASQRSLF